MQTGALCYPTSMRKTSVYLDDEQRDRLAELAEREGKSQAEVIRAAIAAYGAKPVARRRFALAGSALGRSAKTPPECNDPQAYQDYINELMQGFGADRFDDESVAQ